MTASAQGKDVSAFQPPLTPADLQGFDFCFAKATDGLMTQDANFAANWAVMKSAGIHRGAYHELWSSGSASPQAQAAHFLAVVRAQGIEPGDMLAVVASDYRGVSDAEVREFCDLAKAGAPASPVLVYSDLNVARTLTSCTGYDLWVAYPSLTAPADVSPWETWRLWQWGETGTDRDAYNGTAQELQAWLDSVAYPPAASSYGPPRNLTVRPGLSSVLVERCDPPAGAPLPAHYEISVFRGSYPSPQTLIPSYPRWMTAAPGQFGSLDGIPAGEHMTLRAVAYWPDGSHGEYADAHFAMP